MASTTFDFREDDSGSDHEHWPEDFKPTAAVPAPGYDTHNGLREHSYEPAAATSVTMKEASPPPSSDASTEADTLTELHAQYAYAPAKVATGGVSYAYVPAVAPAPAPAPVPAPKPSHKGNMNTYTYHPTFSEKPAVKATNKWQGRTKGEVEEDNQKIAAEEKVWDKRKVVPTGLADDQMCWVVEADASYTLR